MKDTFEEECVMLTATFTRGYRQRGHDIKRELFYFVHNNFVVLDCLR